MSASAGRIERVAMLGTGIMGAPMARRIARAGYAVRAWNRTPSKAEALRGDGVEVAAAPPDAVGGADLVIVMVSTGAVADQVLAAATPALGRGALVAVMSSIPVEAARRQADDLSAYGIGYIDAPVSGGERGATDGTLAIMAGGAEVAVTLARPVLETMGRVTRVGPVGAGQLAKLANQVIVGITIGAVAEALILIERGGGDLTAAIEALGGGFADSPILRQHGRNMARRDFVPGAKAEIQLKDLRTAAAFAAKLGVRLPFAELAENSFERLCAAGGADLDHSALYVELAGAHRASGP